MTSPLNAKPDLLLPTRRRFWIIASLAVAAFYLADIFTLSALRSAAAQSFDEIVQISAYLIAALAFGQAAMRDWLRDNPFRNAWIWLSLAFFSNAIAEAIYGFLLVFLHENNPFPSPADFFYLAFYPFAAIGILSIPSPLRTGGQRIKILLDAAILLGVVASAIIVLLIGPLALQPAQNMLTLADSLSYPVGDMLLIFALVFLFLRGIEPRHRILIVFLAAGMAAVVYADYSFTYLGLTNSYVPGNALVDPFWPLSALITAIAPLIESRYMPRAGTSATLAADQVPFLEKTIGRQVIPYLALPALVFFLWLSQTAHDDKAFFPTLEIVTLVVIAAIVARQIITIGDLEETRSENERARQLDSLKDQFIENVNHELRTPLMSMQLYLDALSSTHRAITEERRATLIARTQESTKMLISLVEGILDIRRIDQHAPLANPVPVPVLPVVRDVFTHVALPDDARAARNITLSIYPDLVIYGEQVRLYEILQNLVSNSLKYSDPGTPIECYGRVLTERPRQIPSSIPFPAAELRIRDYGFGIPPDQIPLLFRRFVRLPRDLTSTIVGTGLGLYLCKSLVESMRGMIWVESAGVPGEGSTFHIILPLPPRGGKSVSLPKEG
jgi:signal transduction histidine kinase